MSDGKPIQVTDDTFESFITDNSVALIDFWAEWCYPCRMIAPVIEALAKQYSNVAIGKLNVDENRETAIRFGVMSIPTLLYFKDGKLVEQLVGVQPKHTIESKLTRLT